MSSERSIGKRIGNIAAIVSAVVVIQGALSWAFKDKIDNYITSVLNENKPSTREDLSQEMDVRKELVVIELGTMYKEFKETQKNIEKFNQTWIPYLEKEKTFFYVGWFVDMENPSRPTLKYRDVDNEDFKGWHDEGGWYYVRDGLKHYK